MTEAVSHGFVACVPLPRCTWGMESLVHSITQGTQVPMWGMKSSQCIQDLTQPLIPVEEERRQVSLNHHYHKISVVLHHYHKISGCFFISTCTFFPTCTLLFPSHSQQKLLAIELRLFIVFKCNSKYVFHTTPSTYHSIFLIFLV